MEEIWNGVVGFEELFEVSSNGGLRFLSGKAVKCRNPKGYILCTLCKNGKRYWYRVHRLVAQAFIPNPENKPEVNHKNGKKWDNRVENLEWSTHKENAHHAIYVLKKGCCKLKGEETYNAKLTENDVREIRRLYKPYEYPLSKLSLKYGVHGTVILGIITGKYWKHVV